MSIITKNITNSGLEQINYKKDSIIYKVNEKPKFACGKNIVVKEGYCTGQKTEYFCGQQRRYKDSHYSEHCRGNCGTLITTKENVNCSLENTCLPCKEITYIMSAAYAYKIWE